MVEISKSPEELIQVAFWEMGEGLLLMLWVILGLQTQLIVAQYLTLAIFQLTPLVI